MLMILQVRSKVTAQELADELEVSVRTIYRDLTALCTAGVPVYTERGPGGGIRLVERYRSNLTGLTHEEVRALSMISIPESLAQLGFDQKLRAALLKLAASLPSSLRGDEVITRQRVHIDSEPWDRDQRSSPVPFLPSVQRAVWAQQVIQVRYQLVAGPQIDSIQLILHPLGLVAKANEWYLVAWQADHLSVLRVDSILELQVLEEPFFEPPEFKLDAYWKSWCQEMSTYQLAFQVYLRVNPDLFKRMPRYFGDRVRVPAKQDEALDDLGWVTCELRFGSHEEARDRLLRFGSAIEVIEPIALRYSLRDYAQQILSVYANLP
jgi:predicted DNA-binding transcriptional regulator YafY